MQRERWQQIDHLFHLALERKPEQRPGFLKQACSGDESLRSEVEALISSHEQAESFIETPASDLAAELFAKGPDGLAVGQFVGPYEIVSVLGVGGMGEVYLAKDTRLGRQVALKLLPAQFTINADRLRRFEQEARAVSALNHPNIVTIHETGRENSSQFIVTEFVEGKTLRRRMAETPVTLRLSLEVSIQVASALEAAHAAGIVHRDIKPENIMLRTDGYVKVLDFGLAKLTEAPPATSDVEASTRAKVQTEAGLVMGTATYMSPEQARGLGVDARTDIFSLGVVLYEMIAARAPFEGATVSDVIAAILKEEPAPLRQYSPEVPVELEWMMKKALAKDREERYQRIKELQIDLKRLKQELELQAKLDGMASPRRQDGSGATRSSGEAIDTSTGGFPRTALTAESFPNETTLRRRSFAIGRRMLVVGIASIAILSAISFYVGLRQVPAPPRPTFRQLTFRRGAIFGARFAPDGGAIIYSAAFDGKPIELFTSRLEGPESSSLKLNAGIQSISSTGEMAILLDCEIDGFGCHNGTLARVPLVGGTPREILEHVYHAEWGPDGQELAIVRDNEEGHYQLEYPIGTVLYKAPGRIGAMRVSPKGDMVAFVDHPILDNTSASILAVDRNGQKRTLSGGWKAVGGLVWSPTGEELWFSASKGGANALYALSSSGSERLVFQAPGNVGLQDMSRDGRILMQRGIPRSRMMVSSAGSGKERDLAWFDWSTSADISSDGKNLLFYERSPAVGAAPFVYLRKMDGSNEPARLGEGKALALSPDGKWALALQENSGPQLVLFSTGPGQPRLLPRGSISEYHYASWFPDGEQILFTGLEAGHELRSYVQDISGGQPQPITEEGIVALLVSPDGKRIVAWAPDSGPDGRYYLSPVDGTKSTPIPGLEMGEMPIQWSADGRALYVRSSGDFSANIYRIDLSSGRRELRKEIVPDQIGFLSLEGKPGGMQITPDGKSYAYTYWTALRDLFLAEGLN